MEDVTAAIQDLQNRGGVTIRRPPGLEPCWATVQSLGVDCLAFTGRGNKMRRPGQEAAGEAEEGGALVRQLARFIGVRRTLATCDASSRYRLRS